MKAGATLQRPYSERGASLVEYALILSLIAVLCIAPLLRVGDRAKEVFCNVADSGFDHLGGPSCAMQPP